MSAISVPDYDEEELVPSKVFHGFIDHEDAQSLLANNGDYLLRLSHYEGRPVYVLSVVENGKVKNFILNQNSNNHQFYFNAHQASIFSHFMIPNIIYTAQFVVEWKDASESPQSLG
ncbi:unnamed protein product [Toxocara canis]|uniref:SH2 domain-containing protein n=1 Tax=Toxocara canis TaxID=6265 RepID=A0A183V5T4_TOXCA|nr:unnamed protein product [Toxocara canis]